MPSPMSSMAISIKELPPFVLQCILDYLVDDILQFNDLRRVCKHLFTKQVLDNQRTFVHRLKVNREENASITSPVALVGLCTPYQQLRYLDLSYFATLKTKHVHEIGIYCVHIEELKLCGTALGALNVFLFPELKVLDVSHIPYFTLRNFYSRDYREADVACKRADPPHRHLHKVLAVCCSFTVAQQNITIDLLYKPGKEIYDQILKTRSPDEVLELVAALDYPPPPSVLVHVCKIGALDSLILLLERGMRVQFPVVCTSSEYWRATCEGHLVLTCFSCDSIDMALLLMKHGADHTIKCRTLGTPLHYAKTLGIAKQVFFPEANCFLDRFKKTALIHACENARWEVALFLITQPCCNVHQQDKSGKSAFDYVMGHFHNQHKTFDVNLPVFVSLLREFFKSGYSEMYLLPYAVTPRSAIAHVLDRDARSLFPRKQLVVLRLLTVMGASVFDVSQLEHTYKTQVQDTFTSEGVGSLLAFVRANHTYFKIVHAGCTLISVHSALHLKHSM